MAVSSSGATSSLGISSKPGGVGETVVDTRAQGSGEERAQSFVCSSVGQKYLMGLAGAVWAGFVLAHMLGNLLLFLSPEAYNAYSYALTSGNIIYVVEAVLILALIVHVGLALRLTLKNRASKPVRYAVKSKRDKKARFASTTMGVQGTIILVFIVLHIATFKYGTYYETVVHGTTMRDLYKLVVEVFHQPGYVVWYLVALLLLGFHLSHGVGSVFQSFGWMNGRYQPLLRKFSMGYAILVAGGFIAQPIFVYFFAN